MTAYDCAKRWVESKLYETDGNSGNRQSINNRYGFNGSSVPRTKLEPPDLEVQSFGDSDSSQEPLEDIFILDNDLCFLYPTRSYGKAYNHTRQKSGSRTNGTYNVTETWILIVGQYADYGAVDDYTIDVQSDLKTGVHTLSINGTIQGYTERNLKWEDQLGRHKINNAERLYQTLSAGSVFHRRVQAFWDSIHNDHYEFNPIPVSTTVKKQTKEGIVQYSASYDTKCTPLVPGAAYEQFTVQMTYPNDVFGTVTIPGRQKGPLFFSANTYTAPKYTINYEVVMQMVACTVVTGPNPKPIPTPFSEPNFWVNPAAKSALYKHIARNLDNRSQLESDTRGLVAMVIWAHHTHLRQNANWDIIKVESHNDQWDPAALRPSGSVTSTGAPSAHNMGLMPIPHPIQPRNIEIAQFGPFDVVT